MNPKRIKKIGIAVLVTAVWLGTFFFLQALLTPKYMTSIREGAMVAEYYEEQREHDIVFIGDCEVYENFSPETFWQEYGITSYMLGSPQQLIWHSYYWLKEVLSYETPQVVVFNVLSMQYGEPQSEAYNRMSLDGMRLGGNKIDAVKAAMMEDESLLSYIFPILRYHSRWQELTAEDWRYLFHREPVTHSGYLMRVDVRGVDTQSVPEGKPLGDYRFSDICYDYLDKIVALCREHDVDLVLIKAPSLYPYWYDEWDAQICAYAQEHDLPYLNFLDEVTEIGLDFATDTYDQGLHLNLSGAEKLSRYFGAWLSEHYDFPDHSQDEELQAIWQQKSEAYQAMKADQYRELAEYGYLKSYGARPPEEGTQNGTAPEAD